MVISTSIPWIGMDDELSVGIREPLCGALRRLAVGKRMGQATGELDRRTVLPIGLRERQCVAL